MTVLTFTDEKVVSFCESTGDDSSLHNPSFMKEKGKLAIVPGQQILAVAASEAAKHIESQGTKLEIYFGAPTSVGDRVTFGIADLTNEEGPEIASFVAHNEDVDILCAEEVKTSEGQGVKYSRLIRNDEMPPEMEGYKRILTPKEGSLERFADAIGRGQDDISRLLFAVSYSSRALFRSAREAKTEGEKGASDAMDKRIPVYRSMQIFVPRERPDIEIGKPIYYTTQVEKTPPNLFTYTLDCHTQEGRLYHAVYKLRPTKEKLIWKTAKAIPE